MTADETHDLVALYVVDALAGEELRDFESHLGSCVECQGEVVEMRALTEGLSQSVEADPPAALRMAVLANIRTTAQVPVAEPDRSTDHSNDLSMPGNVIALRSRMSDRLSYLVAAAAVVVAVVFGGWAVQSHHNASEASNQRADLISLLGASDVRTVTSPATGGGSGTVVLSRLHNEAVFVSSGMPALPDDRVYELWTINDTPVSAGTFNASGNLVTLPVAALSAAQIAVTVEPAGGSSQPTTAPILAVSVPAGS
jgi:anti-sigma-K factor RskA